MDAKQEILALEDRRYKAMVEADMKTLDELFDDDLAYTHSNAVVDTKTSYLDGIRNKRWHYVNIERPEQNVTLFGDTARITGRVRLTLGNPDGSTRAVNGRFLNVWAKNSGAWRMIAWQSTPMPV